MISILTLTPYHLSLKAFFNTYHLSLNTYNVSTKKIANMRNK